MRVSYEWLKEYIDVTLPPLELAEKLTMSGIAVEAVEYPDQDFSGVVVGEILEIKPHPASDHLLVCQVQAGVEKPVQVATGAPNVRVGQRVALALEGAVLPGSHVIKAALFRGVESGGMLCSAQELGLNPEAFPLEQQEGIIEMPGTAPPGTPLNGLLGGEGAVLVLELTPNRSDCLAMLNVAREVAAVAGGTLMPPSLEIEEGEGPGVTSLAEVEFLDQELCSRYTARLIRGIKVGPSPAWLARRLEAAGVRPINNVVDVTNYVMLELGQPLHAFDFQALEESRIAVRRALPGEELVTLDGVARTLDPGMLVIADARRPVALAGVMGGLHTEITPETTWVLLESAHFNPVSVRVTSRNLGLRSESSLRFEKGVDAAGCRAAADRAAGLIARLAGGHVAPGVLDCYPKPRQPVSISLRVRRVNELLGTSLNQGEVRAILARLPLKLEGEGNTIEVEVPSFRPDLSREVDLIEEVARLYGYGRIPSTLSSSAMGRPLKTKRQALEDSCRDLLAALGFCEVINHSFLNQQCWDRLALPPVHPWRSTLPLLNPLSEDQGVMRTTLLPGLLEVAAWNSSRRVKEAAIFELGRVFLPTGGEREELPIEGARLAALVTGSKGASWAWRQVDLDFYFLKGALQEIAQRLCLEDLQFISLCDQPSFHPGRTARVLAGGMELGLIGELHPRVGENYGLSGRPCVMELDMVVLERSALAVQRYRSLPRYPSVERDLALILPEGVPAAKVEETMLKAGRPLLDGVRLFDLYRGTQVPQGKKSMAYSLVFQGKRTLIEQEVTAALEEIIAALRALGAEPRIS